MITSAQLRAARAMLGLDQRQLAELCDLSVPTIQRMEASQGVVHGTVDSLMKLVSALDRAGVELIGEDAASRSGGRGVRLKRPTPAPARAIAQDTLGKSKRRKVPAAARAAEKTSAQWRR